jgi:hypothetical protein
MSSYTNAEQTEICAPENTPCVSSAKVCGRNTTIMTIDGLAVSISGRLLRIAKVRDEPYECLGDSEEFVAKLRQEKNRPDLLTFMQPIGDQQAHHPFHFELESLAVLRITTYEDWWKNKIRTHTRNHIRKAQKKGLEVRQVPFDDDLVRGVKTIFDECPLRQGRPFWHYREDHETIKTALATFLDRSDFIGAFWDGRLIGYIKLTCDNETASVMQIISMITYRDKAPTDALIAKAVELCAERGLSYLHYALWCSGGIGVFKENHGFQRHAVPRYFVPLTVKGRLALKLALHRKLVDHLPPRWRERMVTLRNTWNSLRYRRQTNRGALS